MKQVRLFFILGCSAVFFLAPGVSAAPNINDQYMSYTSSNDWGSLGVKTFSTGFSQYADLTNVSVEEQNAYGDTYYDVEELGLYISDTTLYIGLQTEFDLKDGVNGVSSGDFIFNFDESYQADVAGKANFAIDNTDTDDFAFDFSINSDNTVNLTLLKGSMVGTGVGTYADNYGKDWGITGADTSVTFNNVGLFSEGYYYGDGDGIYSNGKYTLEAAISLDQLSDYLGTLFAANNSVTMFWQPSCGNDFLAARSDLTFAPTTPGDPVPEPETLLLFGIGLVGVSAFGRKRMGSGRKIS